VQKEFDKVIADKNEEISRLKDHSQKLLAQINKAKKQCNKKLEQEKDNLEKSLSKKKMKKILT
jgi:molybdenum-dependent DNA-binding transcriptional regulator ModE